MKTYIYLIRHAHSIYTPDEEGRPISNQGIDDVEIVTEIMKKENIDIVISSPYLRAIQTVEGIAKYNNFSVELWDDFKERTKSDKPLNDFNKAMEILWSDYDFSFENGESNNTAQKRGMNALHSVLERYRGKRIAIGTHGNIMVLIMNYFNDKYNYSFWKQLDMPDIYRLQFDDNELFDVKRIWKRTESGKDSREKWEMVGEKNFT